MKNIFGIDVTENKENIDFDGDSFIIRRVSADLNESLEKMCSDNAIFEKLSFISAPLYIVYCICWFLGIVILGGVLQSGFDVLSAIQSAPFLISIGAAAWIGVITIGIYKRKKEKRIVQSDGFEQYIDAAMQTIHAAREDLRIPPDSKSIDCIAVKYKHKNGRKKQVSFHPMFTHWNLDKFIFIEKDALCLADLYAVHAIPLSSIRSMELCKKKAMFPNWYKEESPHSKTYGSYKIIANQSAYYARYYKIRIADARGDFELFIPNYDQPFFSEITGVFPDTPT